jgi:hypothetical protein
VTEKDALVKKLALIKSTIIGGAFDHFFTALLEDKARV